MARTKGQNRRVLSWTSVPSLIKRPGYTRSYEHTLTLECGHTVVRRFPEHAQFKFSDCPDLNCQWRKDAVRTVGSTLSE